MHVTVYTMVHVTVHVTVCTTVHVTVLKINGCEVRPNFVVPPSAKSIVNLVLLVLASYLCYSECYRF